MAHKLATQGMIARIDLATGWAVRSFYIRDPKRTQKGTNREVKIGEEALAHCKESFGFRVIDADNLDTLSNITGMFYHNIRQLELPKENIHLRENLSIDGSTVKGEREFSDAVKQIVNHFISQSYSLINGERVSLIDRIIKHEDSFELIQVPYASEYGECDWYIIDCSKLRYDVSKFFIEFENNPKSFVNVVQSRTSFSTV